MSLDFSNRNLQGCSFQGQNLTGANFSNADIRGANFTNAILKNANFYNAKAGIQPKKLGLLLLILFVLFGVAGGASGLASVNLTSLFHADYIQQFTIIPGVISSFAIIIFFAIAIRRGFGTDLAVAIGILTGVVAAILWAYLLLRFGFSGTRIANETGWKLLGAAIWEFVGFTIGVIMLAASRLLCGSKNFIFWTAWTIGVLFSTNASRLLNHTSVNWYDFWLLNLIVIVFFGIVCGYISWKTTASNEKFICIYILAVEISAIGGTSFRQANLTNADFTQARLNSTDFCNAKLLHTNFYQTQKIHQARIKNTILINPIVRELLVTQNGVNKSFFRCNLQGAYLVNANLNNANFTEADISEADFYNSNLEGANLTKIQALNTNFNSAILTGACLSTWNIDSTTNIDEVICDYVYLENNQQERRPSSGKFAPGDFTKLFKVAINTVDLIFRNGLDLQVLSDALKKLQLENPGTQLGIQSIENKCDGVVVVRLDVPFDVDKAKIHSDFTQNYQQALTALENSYQAQLKSKDEQITLYQQHQENLQEVIKMLGGTSTQKQENKLVVIKLGESELNTDTPLTLQIGLEAQRPFLETNGKLPSALNLIETYNKWQTAYRKGLQGNSRLNIPDTQITNISKRDLFLECDKLASNLRKEVNNWFNSQTFRPIKEQLLEKLNPSESIRILLQTEDNRLRRIPFHLWDFFERYTKAEIALSSPSYERLEKSISPHSTVKILAIIGDSKGIDVEKDRILLEQLPNSEVTFLVEPQRETLNDELWLQPWDILFFAGHSSTQSNLEIGQLCINQNDSLTIAEFKNALSKAIEQGLHLAIFNSCDGLGLAVNLADLNIPQMIVMREPVPDKVATVFLKNFLREFSHGKPLYQSVREARCQLQGLEYEFPCASWLPVIFQNPGEIDTAPTAWWNF